MRAYQRLTREARYQIAVLRKLNNRPRKCLDSPHQVFFGNPTAVALAR